MIGLASTFGGSSTGHGMENQSTTQASAVLRKLLPSAILAFVAMTAVITGAEAKQGRRSTVEAVAPRTAGEPILAIVSIKSQQVTFYDADGWILRAPVSPGTTGRETPAGVFAVIEKDKDHRSTMYDDAWMPNMQRITWNGIALHGGPLPGYAASHGCVRMPFGFAGKLVNKPRIGMRVIISPDAAKAADAAKKAAAKAAHEMASLTAPPLRKLISLKKSADTELESAEKAITNAKTEQAKARAEDRRQKA